MTTPTTNGHGLTALTEKIDTAGEIVWWRLAGGFDLGALRTAWDAAGLTDTWLPTPPSPPVALRRAVNELRSAERLVRPLQNGGFAVVEEYEVEGELTYTTVFKVGLSKVGRLEFTERSGGSNKTRLLVEEAFARYLDELVQADVSPWLCKVMDRINAAGLRDTGGIYFVPKFAMATWTRIVTAVRASSTHTISCVPALHSDEAAAAVIDAIAQEAKAAATAIETELANGAALGTRALQTRINITDAQEAKIASYEALFGRKLTHLHEQLDALRAGLVTAVFAQQAEEARRDAASGT